MIRLLLLFILTATAFAQKSAEKTPVAKVRDQTIYMEDIQTDEIMELRRKLFEKLEEAIAHQAAGVLENHPHDNDPGHLLDHFRSSVKAGEVQLFIDVPPPMLHTVPVDASRINNPNARVMILEFADSQCPFCKEVYPAVDRLKRRMRKELAVASYHYPLERHAQAYLAAVAMECAREQGAFEKYRRALVGRPEHQYLKDLQRTAKQLKLPDTSSFDDCLSEERYKERIKEDMALAGSLGIDSTPSFIIGNYDPKSGMLTGELVEGAMSFEELTELVNTYIASDKSKVKMPKKKAKAHDSHAGHNH